MFDLMGFLKRLWAPAEDPRQEMRSVFKRHRLLLDRLQEALAGVAGGRCRLEGQIGKLSRLLPNLEAQASQELAAGREPLARFLLQRRYVARLEMVRLQAQASKLTVEEYRLETARERLLARMEILRTRQDVASARYAAAVAQVHLGETLHGVSADAEELARTLDHADTQAEYLEARSAALDAVGTSEARLDLVEGSLLEADAASQVEEELRALKVANAG